MIDNIVLSDDITATIEAVKHLGADITVNESSKFEGRKSITVVSDGMINLKTMLLTVMNQVQPLDL